MDNVRYKDSDTSDNSNMMITPSRIEHSGISNQSKIFLRPTNTLINGVESYPSVLLQTGDNLQITTDLNDYGLNPIKQELQTKQILGNE